jgi:hypothetical protein
VQNDWDRTKRTAIIIGIAGIALELVTVILLASKRIPPSYGTPMVITGMFLAFVPVFVLARRHKGK